MRKEDCYEGREVYVKNYKEIEEDILEMSFVSNMIAFCGRLMVIGDATPERNYVRLKDPYTGEDAGWYFHLKTLIPVDDVIPEVVSHDQLMECLNAV